MKTDKKEISIVWTTAHIRIKFCLRTCIDGKADICRGGTSNVGWHLLEPWLIADYFKKGHQGCECIVKSSSVPINFGSGFGVLEEFHTDGHIEKKNNG